MAAQVMWVTRRRLSRWMMMGMEMPARPRRRKGLRKDMAGEILSTKF
jgi:hypothetical protein